MSTDDPKPPKPFSFPLGMDPAVIKAIQQIAAQDGISVEQVVRNALAQYIRERNPNNRKKRQERGS